MRFNAFYWLLSHVLMFDCTVKNYFRIFERNILKNKQMKGWKTIVFNIISAIILVAETYGVGFGLDPQTIAYIALIGNFVLRFFTTTPVGKSK